jgi:anion-transporting  ArsA/GET3 family ATPase
MMLEPGATIDELVSRHASSPESAERVLANPYYQQLSSTLAGSREFMAVEKLYELSSDPTWDLIIVDTPPSQHALDFLDAPRHLLELMDGTGLGLILRSANVANRLSFGLLRRSQVQFAKFFEFLTGHRLLLDVTDFYHRYADVIDGFKQRAIKIDEMLKADETSFSLVLIPEEDLIEQAENFKAALEGADMQLSCVVFNQVLSIVPLSDLDELEHESKEAGIPAGLLERGVSCHQRWFRVSQRQHKVIKAWRKLHGAAVSLVPRFDTNVSTVDELRRFADTL